MFGGSLPKNTRLLSAIQQLIQLEGTPFCTLAPHKSLLRTSLVSSRTLLQPMSRDTCQDHFHLSLNLLRNLGIL